MSQTKAEGIVFGSALSQAVDIKTAVQELVEGIEKSLGGGAGIDLAFLFISSHYTQHNEVQEAILEKLKPKVLLGCSACGVVGVKQELEEVHGVTLFAARLPGVKVRPFFVTQNEIEKFSTTEAWSNFLKVKPEENPSFFLVPDPFTFDAADFLIKMNELYSGCPVMGGVASAAMAPGQNVLFLNQDQFDQGAVGVALVGNLEVRSLVSQGCRPFGEPMIVTEAEENVIQQLAGKPALDVLRDTFLAATKHDQTLARRSLFVGCVVDEYKQKLERGDFVIRNVLSADQESGAIAIGDYVHVGQTVQFHVRDADSADKDLRELCRKIKGDGSPSSPKGALMFNCNGRGQNMFDSKHHDISTLHQELGTFPTAGFFCAGELGPIGSKNFLHGFTTSIALFYQKNA